MVIDIPSISFNVFENASKISKNRRRWLLRLGMLVLAIIFLGLLALISFLFPDIPATRINNFIPAIVVLIIIEIMGYLISKKIYGKLNLVGKLEFNSQAIILSGKINKIIGYAELIYLTTEFDRPENYFERHPPAKTYIVTFLVEPEEKISIIASRKSFPESGEVDIYDLLSSIRKQNHHLYKALYRIKKYNYE